MTEQIAEVLKGYLARLSEELRDTFPSDGYLRLRARLSSAPAEPVDALEAASGHERVAILGPMGSGKTTVLARLALRAAEIAQEALATSPLPEISKLPFVPVLADLAGTRAEVSTARLVQRGFARAGIALALQTARALVQQVPLLLLLDNLDRAWDRATLQAFAPERSKHLPGLRVILACREAAWDDEAGKGWTTVRLLPVSAEEVSEYLRARLSPEDLAALQRDAELWSQLRLPIFLCAAAEAKDDKGDRPLGRAHITRRVAAQLLPEGLSADNPVLGRVALALVGAGGKPLTRRRWQGFVQEEPTLGNALLSGLLQWREADGSVQFAHVGLRDYCAARALLTGAKPRLSLPRLIGDAEDRQTWQGVIVQLYQMSPQPDDILRQLLSGNDASADAAIAALHIQLGHEQTDKGEWLSALRLHPEARQRAGAALRRAGLAQAASLALAGALSAVAEPTETLAPKGPSPVLRPHAPSLPPQMPASPEELRRALQEAQRFVASASHELALTLKNQNQLEAAEEAARTAVENQPAEAAYRQTLASILWDLGRADEALRQIEQARRLAPYDAEPALMMARYCAEGGRIEEAIAAYRDVIALKPEEAEPHYALAQLLLSAERTEEAIASLQEATRLAPARGPWWLTLARLYLKQGLRSRAQEAYARAADAFSATPTDEADEQTLAQLGEACLAVGRWQEAARAYQTAFDLSPRLDYLKGLMHARHAAQEWPEAIAAAQQIRQIQPEDADALRVLALGYAAGKDWALAEECAIAALRTNPTDAELWLVYGEAALRLGQLDESRQALGQACALAPRDAQARQLYAEALAQSGDWAGAAEQYERQLDLTADDPAIYHRLGLARRNVGDLVRAEIAFRRALSLAPQEADLHYWLGRTLHDQGQDDAALVALRTACQLNPRNGEYAKALAELSARLSPLPQAQADVERAVRLSPQDADLRALLGDVYERQGRLSEAANEFAQAAERAPDNVAAQQRYVHAVRMATEKAHLTLSAETFARATRAAQQACALAGESAELLQDLAVITWLYGDRPGAMDLMRRALQLNPGSVDARRWLGIACREMGLLAESARELVAATRLAPLSADLHAELATTLRLLKRWDEAARALRTACELKPGNADYLAQLGEALLEAGEVEQGREALEEAVAAQPDNAEAHYQLGRAAEAQGQWDRAARAYGVTVNLAPDRGEAHHRLGRVLAHLGEWDQAAVHLRAAVRLDDRRGDWHRDLGAALDVLGLSDEALTHYLRAVELGQREPRLLYAAGSLLRSAGRLAQARALLEQAVQAEPENVRAAFEFALTLDGLGDISGAQATLARVLSSAPEDEARYRWEWAQNLWSQGRRSEAEPHLRLVVERNPEQVEAIIYLAQIRQEQGQPAEALSLVERALERLPRSPELHRQAAELCGQMGRHREAANHLMEAVAIQPADAALRYRLGLALAAAGERDQALAQIRQARRLAPDVGDYMLAQAQLAEETGRTYEAEEALSAAAALRPEDVTLQTRVGTLAAARGDWPGPLAAEPAGAPRRSPGGGEDGRPRRRRLPFGRGGNPRAERSRPIGAIGGEPPPHGPMGGGMCTPARRVEPRTSQRGGLAPLSPGQRTTQPAGRSDPRL